MGQCSVVDGFVSHEYDGILSSLFRMGHGQNEERSGMDMMANPVGTMHSAVKETSPFEIALPSFRSGSCCSRVEVRPKYGYSKISKQSKSYGDYHQQTRKINGAVWYKKYNHDKCIWRIHENNGQWIVGKCSERGTSYGHFTNH